MEASKVLVRANVTRSRISMKASQQLRQIVAEALVLIFCMLPGAFFSMQAMHAPWTTFRTARAILSLQDREIARYTTSAAAYRSEHIGGEIVHATLLDATRWPPESLVLLPLGSLLLAILYYAASRSFGASRWSSAAITIAASWYYPRLYSQYGLQTYVFTNVLFLAYLVLVQRLLKKKDGYVSLGVIFLFISTFFHYHTTPVWFIVSIAGIVFLGKVKLGKNSSMQAVASWALPLFCLVVYLAFDTILYGNALVRLQAEMASESLIQSFARKIVAPLLPSYSNIPQAFEVMPRNPRIATWTTLGTMLLLVGAVGTWCGVKVYRAITQRSWETLIATRGDTLMWIVILVATSHAAVYLFYGAISLRVIPLAFPLLLPLVARAFKRKHELEKVLTTTLAVLAVVGYTSFSSVLPPDTTAGETGLVSQLIRDQDRLLADIDVYGAVLLNAAQDGKLVDLTWLDPMQYSLVVGEQTAVEYDFDRLIADKSDKPVITYNWGYLEPWTWHLSRIEQNIQLDKIYDSDNAAVFQPKGAELPRYQLGSGDINDSGNSLIEDAFRVWLAVIALFFAPGAVLVFVLRNEGSLAQTDGLVLIGLAAGLSVAFVTCVGYAVNFAPLKLAWTVPLIVLIPWIGLGIYLLFRRLTVHVKPMWLARICVLALVLLVWAFLSTVVAHARVQGRAEFTEFFVTQDETKDGVLDVNVVSRLSQPTYYTLVFELGGYEVQTIGPRLVHRNSVWIEEWEVPPVSGDERLLMTLEKNGVSFGTLELSSELLDRRKSE